MDYATLFGIGTVLVVVAGSLVAGTSGDWGTFWSLPSLLIVVGGAIAATFSSLVRHQMRNIRAVTRQAFLESGETPEGVIQEIVGLAVVARREGLLALDSKLPREDNRFLARALRMVIDGYEPSTIFSVLSDEIEATDTRHGSARQIFEMLGRYSPRYGLIGTVIGLIIMLRSMNDPTKIGPGMAVALLTTLYGLLFANAIFHPLAQKLANRNSEELLIKTIIIKGAMAIHQGDNPRVVEQKLRAFLPQPTSLGEGPVEEPVHQEVEGLSLGEAVGAAPVARIRDSAVA